MNAEVLVVGAGPAGLTAAIVLAQHGRQVMIVDALGEGANTSRAAVVHPRTLEVLEPYGVADRLAAHGVHTPVFAIRDRDKMLVPVPFGGLPTAYPYALMISQADTEAHLLARLHELGGKVIRPARVSTVEQDADGVTATLDDGRRIRAAYLIGADGLNSTVRQSAGIGFTGGTYAESFVLADVRLSGGVPQNEVILYFSPAGLVVVAPLPGGLHRIVATVDEAPKEPGIPFVQHLLDTRGPEAEPARVRELIWSSRFRVHHRVADTYRRGRLLLAGDAAHVHSPAGGQGMNLGVDDAVHLGETLARVLKGEPDSLLDSYAATRRPQAEQVIALAGRLTRLATAADGRRVLRNLVLALAGRVPAVRTRLAWQLSGLNRREAA
ncbi:FAD-binding protein [Microbispora triticiradicis]|uniref:FAD-binding protein n=3 Tax=Microbispora TaxID=2005 RepID=A0ABY3M023_9ACTN|nr:MULTISPECIES: FAD-dependent monooxygenase [Microbispora]RGA05057.1 FAD-binding protein [Microbispora triticiradicis]TLP60651.1 FAD-binding protein [Microbispora fusca]TYB61952.1 FAD-binding protein [Microbispora tritici]GLW26834.1 pentachlorophenol monooxygenase [Microbispora amethystogenes]